MDPVSQQLVPPPPRAPRTFHQKLVLTAVLGFIAALIVVALCLLTIYGFIGPNIHGRIFTTLTGQSSQGLYLVNGGGQRSLELFSVPSLANGTITAAAFGSLYNYYFVTDPKTLTTKVYQEDVKGNKGSPRTLIASKTFKFNVSYDPGSNTLAYLSINPATVSTSTSKSVWDVVVAHPSSATASSTERVIARGQSVALLKGGILAVVQEGNKLVLINTITGSSTPMLGTDIEAPFAIDADAGMLALYNEGAHTIQFFNIRSAPTATFVSATKVSAVPQQLRYVNHTLLLGAIEKTGKTLTLVLSLVGSPLPYAKIPLPTGSAPVFIGPLIYAHE